MSNTATAERRIKWGRSTLLEEKCEGVEEGQGGDSEAAGSGHTTAGLAISDDFNPILGCGTIQLSFIRLLAINVHRVEKPYWHLLRNTCCASRIAFMYSFKCQLVSA